jgi:hypothetical protein
VLIPQRSVPGIVEGATTLAFRRWKRPQVLAGRVYRTAAGRLHVDDVTELDEAGTSVSEADAHAAGHASAGGLLAELPPAGPGLHLYRIAVHRLDEPDPRSTLAADDDLDDATVAELDQRLARLDAARPALGPWTRATLEVIADHPARRAGDLAGMVGREREPFKLDVRKLKALGLTESLEVGYRLSPRGRRYLALTRRQDAAPAPPPRDVPDRR